MNSYSVWMEGYTATGDYAPAHLVGNTIADSFKEACFNLLKDDPYFNVEDISVWGCKLFDNEVDARVGFG